jgi:hypothetical protein
MTIKQKGIGWKLLLGGFLLSISLGAGYQGGRDTPVVLVGASLTFKAPTIAWQSSGANFQTTPTYPITTIVVKALSAPDAGDGPVGGDLTAPDKLVVDVTGASSWEVDAFTNASSSDPGAILSFSGTAVTLSPKNGYLCPNASYKRIKFGTLQSCTDANSVLFTKIRVVVNSQEVGFLDCVDGNGQPGICRIVLRSN